MDELKLLQLKFVELTGSYKDFSENLRWLCWHGFSKSTIPSELFMGNLVAIDMSYGDLQEFEPPTVLQSLKIVNLKSSLRLVEIRNIARLPNLETLILWNCHRLVHVCESLGDLTHLAILNMTGCENLGMRLQTQTNSVARIATNNVDIGSTQLSFPFPHSLQRLFLKDWNLGCNDEFPYSFISQLFLQYLNLGNGLFEHLPPYNHLKNLRVLDFSLCSRLKCLLCLPSTLSELYIYYCKSLEKVTFESHQFTLQEFGYEGCINLSEVEGFIKLVPLGKLNEADLGHLNWLKAYQNLELCLAGDDELTIGRSWQIQMLYEFNITSTSLPAIKAPIMMPEYTSELTSLSFIVPSCPKDRRLKGLNVTFQYTISGHDWAWFAKISTANGTVDLMYNPKVFGKPGFGESAVWLSYWPIGNKLNVGDTVNVSIIVMMGLEIQECGASLVYADDGVAYETLQNNITWEEVLGGDVSAFQLSTRAYYLCRRDFFGLMEVGRLTPGWFSILVGDTADYTEVRGWRKTGRPQQSYQSFTELKTVKCIVSGPESEEIYKIMEISKSYFVDKSVEFTSTILGEKRKFATTSEFSDVAMKRVDKSEASCAVNETAEFISTDMEKMESSASEVGTFIAKGILDRFAMSSHSLREDRNYEIYLSWNAFDTDHFGDHLKYELEKAGFHVSVDRMTLRRQHTLWGRQEYSGPSIQVDRLSDEQSMLTRQPTKENADEVEDSTYQTVEEGLSLVVSQNPNLEDSTDGTVLELNRTNDGAAEDGSYSKKRKTDFGSLDVAAVAKTIREPRVFRTKSEVDDGYHWRKYGKKTVKGSPISRNYYRCARAGCSVKKRVQRESDDPSSVITTYEGQHNHDMPVVMNNSNDSTSGSGNQSTRLEKDAIGLDQLLVGSTIPEQPPLPTIELKDAIGQKYSGPTIQVDSSSDEGSMLGGQPSTENVDEVQYATYEAVEEGLSAVFSQNPNLEDSTDGTVLELNRTNDGAAEDDSYSKKRKTDFGSLDVAAVARTIREPRVVLRTKSEVDILDDGHRWRKYGQKAVKGSPFPRSYYRCARNGCPAKKHVQRESDDPTLVITTYRGQHNHDMSVVKNNSNDSTSGSGNQSTRLEKDAIGLDQQLVGSIIPEKPPLPAIKLKASIVVLSESYTSSTRHLKELHMILEKRRNSNHFVLPVFYDLESSYIKEHGKDLLLQRFQGDDNSMRNVDRWYEALTEVANLPSFNFPRIFKYDDNTTGIKEIVSMVTHALSQ